jgi:hypothetical protein
MGRIFLIIFSAMVLVSADMPKANTQREIMFALIPHHIRYKARDVTAYLQKYCSIADYSKRPSKDNSGKDLKDHVDIKFSGTA